MTYDKLEKGRKVHAFTLLLVVIAVAVFIQKYYDKVVYERDRLEAKRIQQAVATVLAKQVGSDLTYDDGRVHWTLANAIFLKQGIVENLALDETIVPFPKEKGYYYYMYLESPYTIVKLPYEEKGHPQIDLSVVTEKYLDDSYPKKEYAQVKTIPKVLDSFESNVELFPEKNIVVCLNT